MCPKDAEKMENSVVPDQTAPSGAGAVWFGIYCLPRPVWKLRINTIWTTSSTFGTYRLCEQRRFRRAWASAQSRQNLHCSLIQAVSQEEPSDRKPDPWPLWMAGHAQLKFVMMECSKTQIRLTGLIFHEYFYNHATKTSHLCYVCPLLLSISAHKFAIKTV